MLCVWMQIEGKMEERGLHTLKWIAVTRRHHTSVLHLHFCKGPAAAAGAHGRRDATAGTKDRSSWGRSTATTSPCCCRALMLELK